MSLCVSSRLEPEEAQRRAQAFIDTLYKAEGTLMEWNLLRIRDMYYTFKDPQDPRSNRDIVSDFKQYLEYNNLVDFRSHACFHPYTCCGLCTRKCHYRCVQDILNRIYDWVHQPPPWSLQVQMLYTSLSRDTSPSYLTLCDLIGDIINTRSNTALREHLERNVGIKDCNPYRLDYAPVHTFDALQGKKQYNHTTGEYYIRSWPETGLCPYCLPKDAARRVSQRAKLSV